MEAIVWGSVVTCLPFFLLVYLLYHRYRAGQKGSNHGGPADLQPTLEERVSKLEQQLGEK